MDQTADPCNDFFQYACGDWNKKHVIPEDRTSISTFEVMADQLQVILKGITQGITNNNLHYTQKIYWILSFNYYNYVYCLSVFKHRYIGERGGQFG